MKKKSIETGLDFMSYGAAVLYCFFAPPTGLDMVPSLSAAYPWTVFVTNTMMVMAGVGMILLGWHEYKRLPHTGRIRLYLGMILPGCLLFAFGLFFEAAFFR